MTTDDSTGIALGLITFLLIVAVYVWTALALSAVFRKSGEPGWKAWVPILNQIVLLQLGRFSPLLFLLVLIPFVGPIILWALLVIACYRINLAFGYGVGMTVLAALVQPIWASILGFGPARWLGAESGARGAPSGGPRRTAAADGAARVDGAYVPRATPPAYSPSLAFPSAAAAPVPGAFTAPPAPAMAPFAAPPAPVTGVFAAPPAPAPPARAWTPPPADPVPPASAFAPSPAAGRSTPEPSAEDGRWGGFDLGAMSEVTSEVTGADPAAPAPVSAVPDRAAVPPAVVSARDQPLSPAPAAPASPIPPVASAASAASAPPVTRVPAAPAPAIEPEPWAPIIEPQESSVADEYSATSGQDPAVAGSPDQDGPARRRTGARPPWESTPRSARSTVSAQHTGAEIPEDPIDETIITRRRRTAWSLVPPSGSAVPITADVVLLGRKPAPDRDHPSAQLISIDDGTVSKTHARLSLRDEHWYVTDLGSTNGVLFATLMGTEIEVTPGEEVEAGERFFLGDAEVRLQRSDG